MTLVDNLTGLGVHAEQARILNDNTVNNSPIRFTSTGLVATGTTITDALQLSTGLNYTIATVASGTGVKLHSNLPIGQIVFIQNNGANPVNLFPPTAAISINNGSLGAAVTIAAAAANILYRETTTNFLSYVLAKEA